MRKFNTYKDKFKELYRVIVDGHKDASGNRGHGLDHDVTVAHLAVSIAPDQRTGEMAWVSGMIHSTDRFVQNAGFKDIPSMNKELEVRLRDILKSLPKGYFSEDETEQIFSAAFRHEEKNKDDQGIVQQVLQDADRLANLDLLLVIRAAQFRPTIKAIDFEHIESIDPASNYFNPQTVFDVLRMNLVEYIPQLRLPLAIGLAKSREKDLVDYIEKVKVLYRGFEY